MISVRLDKKKCVPNEIRQYFHVSSWRHSPFLPTFVKRQKQNYYDQDVSMYIITINCGSIHSGISLGVPSKIVICHSSSL